MDILHFPPYTSNYLHPAPSSVNFTGNINESYAAYAIWLNDHIFPLLNWICKYQNAPQTLTTYITSSIFYFNYIDSFSFFILHFFKNKIKIQLITNPKIPNLESKKIKIITNKPIIIPKSLPHPFLSPQNFYLSSSSSTNQQNKNPEFYPFDHQTHPHWATWISTLLLD